MKQSQSLMCAVLMLACGNPKAEARAGKPNQPLFVGGVVAFLGGYAPAAGAGALNLIAAPLMAAETRSSRFFFEGVGQGLVPLVPIAGPVAMYWTSQNVHRSWWLVSAAVQTAGAGLIITAYALKEDANKTSIALGISPGGMQLSAAF
jgi:hypothetical protein